MSVSFGIQPVREIRAPDGSEWTVRIHQAGVDDPPMRFFVGPGYWIGMAWRRIAYRLAGRTEWQVRVHPGRQLPGGGFGPILLDEQLPDKAAAVHRAEDVATTLARRGWPG